MTKMGTGFARLYLLNYAPGLLKEALVIRDGLVERGWSVALWLDLRFADQCRERGLEFTVLRGAGALVVRANAAAPLSGLRVAIFYNNAPANPGRALWERISGVTKIVTFCHEPRKPLHGMGLRFQVRRLAAEAVQEATLRQSDVVVVLSENGGSRFRVSYPWFSGEVIQGRLLIPDESATEWKCVKDLKYVTLPGHPNGSTGHEEFWAVARRLHGLGVRTCLLYSGAPSSEYWCSPTELVREGIIRNAYALTDADIREVFRRSWGVVRLDRSCAQSGTIPVAFMMGRPVIVRNIPGLTEFVTRGQNGLVLEDPITAESVAGAVRTIQDDFQAFSAAARAAYLAQFSPKILHQALLTPILAALGQRDTDGE